MRGQTKNPTQQTVVAKLKAKGWREGSMFAKAVPMYFDRPADGVLPRPAVVHVQRTGKVEKGYPRSN